MALLQVPGRVRRFVNALSAELASGQSIEQEQEEHIRDALRRKRISKETAAAQLAALRGASRDLDAYGAASPMRDSCPDAFDEVEAREWCLAQIHAAGLTAREAEIVTRIALGDETGVEVGRELGIADSTVRVTYRNTLAKLRKVATLD